MLQHVAVCCMELPRVKQHVNLWNHTSSDFNEIP